MFNQYTPSVHLQSVHFEDEKNFCTSLGSADINIVVWCRHLVALPSHLSINLAASVNISIHIVFQVILLLFPPCKPIFFWASSHLSLDFFKPQLIVAWLHYILAYLLHACAIYNLYYHIDQKQSVKRRNAKK